MLLLRPAPLFFPTLVCHLILCFVHFSRMLCKSDGWNHRRKKYVFVDVKFRDPKKVLRRKKVQKLPRGSCDLPASGLWSQHASTAPSCSDAAFIQRILCSKSTCCEPFLTVVQNGWFELPEKRLRFLVGFL